MSNIPYTQFLKDHYSEIDNYIITLIHSNQIDLIIKNASDQHNFYDVFETRTFTCLASEHIHCMQDLLRYIKEYGIKSILDIPYLGKKSYREVQEELYNYLTKEAKDIVYCAVSNNEVLYASKNMKLTNDYIDTFKHNYKSIRLSITTII